MTAKIADKDAVHEVLAELIAIPSPSPPGDTRGVAEKIAQMMEPFGFRMALMAPLQKPEKESVLATFDTQKPGPTLMLHAHIDTVPVGSGQRWQGDPFALRRADGNDYGLGACDDKGQMAAMMVAACRAASAKAIQTGKLLVVGAADEEAAGDYGTRYLLEQGVFDKVDVAIIGEQTHNRMALAHKGTYRTRLVIRGKSVHATNPDRGVNAVYAMARAGVALEAYHASLRQRPHALVGNPTCSMNIVQGGEAANLVADYCEAWIDRRFVPGERPEEIVAELRDTVARALEGSGANWEFAEAYAMPAFEESKRNHYTQLMGEVIAEVAGLDPEPTGYLPGSDAKFFPQLPQVTTAVFGAGSYEQAHSENEFVNAAELEQCAAILERLIAKLLGS